MRVVVQPASRVGQLLHHSLSDLLVRTPKRDEVHLKFYIYLKCAGGIGYLLNPRVFGARQVTKLRRNKVTNRKQPRVFKPCFNWIRCISILVTSLTSTNELGDGQIDFDFEYDV